MSECRQVICAIVAIKMNNKLMPELLSIENFLLELTTFYKVHSLNLLNNVRLL